MLRTTVYVAPLVTVMSVKNVVEAAQPSNPGMGNKGKGYMYGDMSGGGMDME